MSDNKLDNFIEQNEKVERKEVEKGEEVETKKDYNNNNKVDEIKPLEQEVKEESDKKFLAKTIVDLKEENTQIKNMLEQVLSKLKINSNEFVESQTSSTNKVDNNNDDSKYFIKLS